MGNIEERLDHDHPSLTEPVVRRHLKMEHKVGMLDVLNMTYGQCLDKHMKEHADAG